MNVKVLAIAALISLTNSACTLSLNPLKGAEIAPEAIYEQNTGKRITQAKVLAQVAVGYGKLGQQDVATKLLSPAIQTAKVNSSIRYQAEMLGEVAASYVKMGQYEQALQVAKPLAKQKHQDDKYGAIVLDRIIRELVATKQLDKATQVARLISISPSITVEAEADKGHIISQAMALTRLAGEYTKAGQREKALKVLDQALQEVKASGSRDLTAIALAYAAAGQRNRALQLLSQATRIDTDEHISHYIYYFVEAAVAYSAIGQKNQALHLLTQIEDKVKQEGGAYMHNDMMIIAVGYAEIGEYNQAFQIAKTIRPYQDIPKEVGKTPDGLFDGSTSHDVFTQLAGRFAEANQYNLALQAIEEIQWTGNRSAAMTKLAAEYAKAKQYDQAFQILSEFEIGSRNRVFTRVVQTVVQGEQGDRAAQLLAQALEVADTPDKLLSSRDPKKDSALAVVASGYAEIGQREQAEPLLAKAHQIAKKIRGDEQKAVALAAVANGYAEIGQKEQAELLLTQARQIGEGINH